MNIQSAIIEGTNILKDKYIRTAQLDAEILMAEAIKKNRKYIAYIYPSTPITSHCKKKNNRC